MDIMKVFKPELKVGDGVRVHETGSPYAWTDWKIKEFVGEGFLALWDSKGKTIVINRKNVEKL